MQKSCVFKLFHSRERIQKVPFSQIFLCEYVRCSVDGRPNRNNKKAFSNLSGIVWTRPEIEYGKSETRFFRALAPGAEEHIK